MASAAFDLESAVYDEGFGRNPVGLLFRHTVQERLLQLFPRGRRVLDLGCGTGEDALALAAVGVRVHGIDVAPGMIAQARRRAEEAGVGAERADFEVRPAEDVGQVAGPPFDGAYSDFGALNCTDLRAVGEGLARVLRPGAPVLLSLMGPWPLPATLHHALTGRGEPRRWSRPRVAGREVPVTYPTPSEIRRALGSGFRWHRTSALGVLVPGPDHAAWAWSNPQSFGVLAAFERVVRGWPLLRGLGDHLLLEGVRA